MDLTKLIQSIEDNLTKQIEDIKINIGVTNKNNTVTKTVFTPLDKIYSKNKTHNELLDEVLNDKDNLVIDVEPKCTDLPKNAVILYPPKKENDILNKLKTGFKTIQYIKNNIISLSYTNKQICKKVVNDRIRQKIKELEVLKKSINQSIIFNQPIKDKSNELMKMIDLLIDEIKKILGTTNPKQEITIPDEVLKYLQEKGFIENTTVKPYKWIKTNSTTRGKNPNKKALIDLLCLLGYDDDVITDIKLLNDCFTFSNNKPIKANNLTDLTDKNGKLKHPIISEYHTELETIVKQSKER